MDWINIKDAAQHAGKEIEIRGWLYNKTQKGKLLFLMIRDGTGTIQGVVFIGDVSDETFRDCEKITQESSLIITGVVAEDKRAMLGYELQVRSLKIIQIAEEYPITPKEHGTTFLMDHRHLWLRSSRQHVKGQPHSLKPAISGSKAYLAQSGQLYSEAAIMSFGKVYTCSPAFRAEKSKTRRHLTEFWLVEPEMAFYDLDENIDLAEQHVCYLVERVLENKQEELKIIERDTKPLENITAPFPRISYDEAVKILQDEGIDFEWGGDFGGTDETILSEKYDKPLFVHRYPAAVKAFYMKRDAEREELALGCDLLAPEGYGEMIGGGQREENLDILLKRLKEHNLPQEAFDWYIDLRKYGSVPHSGYGLGIERTLAWICKLKHVRETIPFPRMMHRVTP